MIRITKDVLRKLNAAIGKLDADCGKVFVGFIGRLHMSDRLYHGDLHYADVGDDPPRDTVSIKTILSTDSSAKHAKVSKPAKSAKSAPTAKPDQPNDTEK